MLRHTATELVWSWFDEPVLVLSRFDEPVLVRILVMSWFDEQELAPVWSW